MGQPVCSDTDGFEATITTRLGFSGSITSIAAAMVSNVDPSTGSNKRLLLSSNTDRLWVTMRPP
jgi:hypothetical protein